MYFEKSVESVQLASEARISEFSLFHSVYDSLPINGIGSKNSDIFFVKEIKGKWPIFVHIIS